MQRARQRFLRKFAHKKVFGTLPNSCLLAAARPAHSLQTSLCAPGPWPRPNGSCLLPARRNRGPIPGAAHVLQT